MILYDKECHLLGISKSILDFLGYEDIEEFKTYTNDVADLFQNRPGYIHRFKNFSWINYISQLSHINSTKSTDLN